MMENINQLLAAYVAANPWILALIVWSVVWKLIALWKAARNGHLTMFIVIAFVNTAGLLEIGYLLFLRFRAKKDASAA